jgi:hypothetical protein
MKEQSSANIPSEIQEKMARGMRHAAESGVMQQALKRGDVAPDFILPDSTGKPVSLTNLLEEGPVILGFYRGGW